MADTAALAQVIPAGAFGMITLKGDLAATEVAAAVQAATGLTVPQRRRIRWADGCGAAWMAPDEVLLIVPADAVDAAMTAARDALGAAFVTLADVSGARVAFRIEGPRADEVLMKLAPVDIARMEPGEVRRSRAAQVAVAFWRDGAGFTLLCFRSVAGHVGELLAAAAAPGGAVLAEGGGGA